MKSLILEGEQLYKARHYREALQLYRSVLEKETDNLSVRESLARCLLKTRDYEACRIEIGRVLEMNPKSPVAHCILGDLLLAQRQSRESETELRRAIELDPNLGHAYHSLSMVLAFQNQKQEAVSVLQRALSLQPQNWQYHLSLSLLYQRGGHRREAFKEARAAYDLHPSLRTLSEMASVVMSYPWLFLGWSALCFICLAVHSVFTLPILVVVVAYGLLSSVVAMQRVSIRRGLLGLAIIVLILAEYRFLR
jgi:tetratricopeptide (TPR) repeat protein